MAWDGSSASVLSLPISLGCSIGHHSSPPRNGLDTAGTVLRRKERVGSGGGCPPAPHPAGDRPARREDVSAWRGVRRPPSSPARAPRPGGPRAQGKPHAGCRTPAPVPPPPRGPGLPPRAAPGPPRTAHEREPGKPVRGAAAAAAVHSLRSRRRRGEAWRTPTW